MLLVEEFERLESWIKHDVDLIFFELKEIRDGSFEDSIAGYLQKKDVLLKASFDIQTLIAMLLKIKTDMRLNCEDSSLISPYRIRMLNESLSEQLNYYSKLLYGLSEQIRSVDVILNHRFGIKQKEN